MLSKVSFLGLFALLLLLTTASSAQPWGCFHEGYHYGGYGGGFHAGFTHYNPYTGNLQHYSTGGGYGAYGGYHYGGAAYGGYHYGGYSGFRGGYVRRW